MKKVLLSLSMLAAVMTASAQNFKIWNATDATGFAGAGSAFVFSPGSNAFKVDTTAGVITATGTVPASCASTTPASCYYINGFGNGSYSAEGKAQPWGYSATNFAKDKFFMNVDGKGMKIKVQFTSFTNNEPDADLYGYEFDLTDVAAGYADQSILLSSFKKIVGNDPTGSALTADVAAKIGKIEIVVIKTANEGIGAGTIKLRNMTIGTSTALSTASAAANIASTKVFPNPSTSAFTAEVSLKNAASTTIILSDMMGKQISSKSVDNNGQANFETAGLSSGIYTVTYVVDGTPAKSELVIVK